jgi:hypothetical protein
MMAPYLFGSPCHPDRNPGRGEAVEVIKELLKLREDT